MERTASRKGWWGNSTDDCLHSDPQPEQFAVVSGQRIELEADRQPLTQPGGNAQRGSAHARRNEHILRRHSAFFDLLPLNGHQLTQRLFRSALANGSCNDRGRRERDRNHAMRTIYLRVAASGLVQDPELLFGRGKRPPPVADGTAGITLLY